MASEFCPVPSEFEVMRACFEDRDDFVKGASWSRFRDIFGPFLSGRKQCDDGWKEDRRLFDRHVRERILDLNRRQVELVDEADQLCILDYDHLQIGFRILILKNVFRALGCHIDDEAGERLAQLSRCLAREDSEDQIRLIKISCHAEVEVILRRCHALWELSASISRDDPRWMIHTAWQILFASVESTSLAIEAALAVYLGGLPRHGAKLEAIRPNRSLQLALLNYPSTYNMVFDIEKLPAGDAFLIEPPAVIHVAIDKVNRTLEKRSSRGRYSPFGFAFGGGPRLCPGRHVALMEASTILNALVENSSILMPSQLEYVRTGFFAHFRPAKAPTF